VKFLKDPTAPKTSVANSTFHTVNYRVKRQEVKGKIDFFFPTFLEHAAPIASNPCRTLRKKRPNLPAEQKCLKKWGYQLVGIPQGEKDPTLHHIEGLPTLTEDVGHVLPGTGSTPCKHSGGAGCGSQGKRQRSTKSRPSATAK